jgi:hypothetical protein
MSRKLRFGCTFSNGTIGTMVVDLRQLRKNAGWGPAPNFQGGEPPYAEAVDWISATLCNIAERIKKTIQYVYPDGTIWQFQPGKRPQWLGQTEMSDANLAMTLAWLLKSSVAGRRTFANGSIAIIEVDFSTTLVHLEITLCGPRPATEEAEAWLSPLFQCASVYGVPGLEEELCRIGLLWWRPPRAVGPGFQHHIGDFFSFSFKWKPEERSAL